MRDIGDDERCNEPRVDVLKVQPFVAAVVQLVRDERLVPTSTELADARGSLTTDLSDGQSAVVHEATGPMSALVAEDVSVEEAWVCLVVVLQVMLSSHDFPSPTIGAEQWASAVKRILRARVETFRDGGIAKLWKAHRASIVLPTTATWERKQSVSLSRKRENIGRQAGAALDVCDGKRGSTIMADVPTAPPGERELHCMESLLPTVEGVTKPRMEAEYTRLNFHRPERRAAEMHASLATKEARSANAKKWAPVQEAAQVKKAPGATSISSRHLKKVGARARSDWAIINEAIERRAVPVRVRLLLTSPYVTQLLKRDANRRYSEHSKTRTIGLTEAAVQDALRPRANRAAKVLACVLPLFGQSAVGVKAGGESAQGAAQARCDMSPYTVTIAIDFANAFGLLDNELTMLCLIALIDLVGTDERVRQALKAADIPLSEAIADLEFIKDDLVWTRTILFYCLTVVEGVIRRIMPNIGETQGGLFSALRYVIAKAMAVDRPLSIEFVEFVMRSIVDDGITQVHVRSAADLERIVAWMQRLEALVAGRDRPPYVLANGDELPLVGVMGRLNFGKFKIQQHVDAVGTEYDVASIIERLPYENAVDDAGVPYRKFPTVTRGVIEFNGVAIGFDVAARQQHVLHEVDLLEEKVAALESVTDIIGMHRAEMYGRRSYRATGVLVHQARASPPSVTMPGMERATQVQLRLFRSITKTSSAFVGGAMEEWQGTAMPEACASRCSLSVHLPSIMGGCNWSEARLIAAFVSMAKEVDTYPTIAAMADMTGYPRPEEWSTCNVRALREAAATLERLVEMRAFHIKPPGDASDWEVVHRLLVGEGRSVKWCNVPKLAGRKLQRVATRAYALELLHRALRSPAVSELTKVRLMAAAQPGAGEWCCMMGLPNAHVRMKDHAFSTAMCARIGHPHPDLRMDTRCQCSVYTMANIPSVPGPHLGLAGRPMVSEEEHMLGVHFHQCLRFGMSTSGHNAVSWAWCRALRRLGYVADVAEVPLGVNHKQEQVKGDGWGKNAAAGFEILVWDTRVSSAYLSPHRKKAAKAMYVVTDVVEAVKRHEKEPACQRCLHGRAVFLPVVCNSLGGLGREAWEWLVDAHRRMADDTQSSAGKQRVAMMLQLSLAEITIAVQNRNSMILDANATVKARQAPMAAAVGEVSMSDVQMGDVVDNGAGT